VNAAHVPRKILHDHQIVVAACDQTIGLGNLLTVNAFAAALAFNKGPFDGTLISILDPLPEQSLLIGQASDILIQSTDPSDSDCSQYRTVTRG